MKIIRHENVDVVRELHFNKIKDEIGITLVALVITIILLLIIAGVSIAILTGENGLINKVETASEKTKKNNASEKINLKITTLQIETYAKKQMMPTLQELADAFYLDEEIEYVITKNEVASTEIAKEKINVTGYKSIYTKLKEYPYEFEINSSLQLASIDRVKIESSKDINNAILNESSIINDLKIKAEEKGKKITIDLDEEVEIDKNLIKGYIIALNNKTYDICKALPYTTSLLEAETDYEVKIIVIDEDIKCKISNTIAIKTSALEEVNFIREYSLGKGNVSVINTYSGSANDMVDSDKNTTWRGNAGAYGTLDFGYEIIPTEFYICIPCGTTVFKIQGSKDNSVWVDLTDEIQFSQSINSWIFENETKGQLKSNNTYRYYRCFPVTYNANDPSIAEFNIWGLKQ